MNKINELTDQLLIALEEGHDRFLNEEKPVTDRAFFNMVKKEADPVFKLLDEWVHEATSQINNHTLDLHPQQIDATKENMESLVLHSFYQDTRKRRFMEIYKSCYYIFTQSKKEHD